MREVFLRIILYIVLVYIIFQVIISIRNLYQGLGEYTRKIDRYQKGDGIWLILSAYLLSFFRVVNLGFIHIKVPHSIPINSYRDIYMIPFTWIREIIALDRFHAFVEGQSYRSFIWMQILENMGGLILLLLPLVIIFFMIWSGRWLGLLVAEVITGLAFVFNYPYFLGDGLLIVAVSYLICKLVSLIVKKKYKKSWDIKWKYGFLVSLILISGILLTDVSSQSPDSREVVEAIDLDESYTFYNGLVKLNLKRLELVTNNNGDRSIRFVGQQEIDPSLNNIFGEDVRNDVGITYKYNYYGVSYLIGIDQWLGDEGLLNVSAGNGEDSYLDFYRNSALKLNEDESQSFFDFLGVESLNLSLSKEDMEAFVQVISIEAGKDAYPFVEYTYKVRKLDGHVLDVYTGLSGTDSEGREIEFYRKDPVVVEDQANYQIVKVIAYTSEEEVKEEELENSKVTIYSVSKNIEGLSTDICLVIKDEEDLK